MLLGAMQSKEGMPSGIVGRSSNPKGLRTQIVGSPVKGVIVGYRGTI